MMNVEQPTTKTSSVAGSRGEFHPARICEVEITQPIPALPLLVGEHGKPYRRALVVVRLHSQPIGIVELALPEGQLDSAEVAASIWRALESEIVSHLRQDGLESVSELTPAGLETIVSPACIADRRELMRDAPFVSVVVATRERVHRLAGCLQSLLHMEYPQFEIIVVDNVPTTDATATFISKTFGDRADIRYVRELRPGLSAARNRGLMEAAGDIVAFTDDDVVVDTFWLAELVANLTKDQRTACVTGLLLPAELETQAQEWFEQFGGFGKGFKRRAINLAEGRPEDPLFPYTAGTLGTGASSAFRASFLRDLGGFDVALGTGTPALGGEDLSIYFEVVMRGYTVIYDPGAMLYHFNYRELDALRKQMYGYGAGLTAFLTRTLVVDPRRILGLARRVPGGVALAVSPRSRKNMKKRADYPRELTRLERRGMLYGPIGYFRARRQLRRIHRRLGALSISQPSSPRPEAVGTRQIYAPTEE